MRERVDSLGQLAPARVRVALNLELPDAEARVDRVGRLYSVCARLRQGRADAAIDDLDAARARWPEDLGLRRRFAMAALLAGRQLDGLQALDTLIEARADDEPSLALALFMLYLAFDTGTSIESASQDRERMRRLADRYRVIGGPSLALVEAWVTAAAGKQ
jgi:hypothetical protein